MQKRRYEILLPLKHNDGRPVSDETINQTREELLDRFEGASFSPHSIRGIWQHEGKRYEDELVRITVDVEESNENRQFFRDWKAILQERFEQLEIYIVSYLVERI